MKDKHLFPFTKNEKLDTELDKDDSFPDFSLDEELEKGRGPDKQPRKKRGDGEKPSYNPGLMSAMARLQSFKHKDGQYSAYSKDGKHKLFLNNKEVGNFSSSDDLLTAINSKMKKSEDVKKSDNSENDLEKSDVKMTKAELIEFLKISICKRAGWKKWQFQKREAVVEDAKVEMADPTGAVSERVVERKALTKGDFDLDKLAEEVLYCIIEDKASCDKILLACRAVKCDKEYVKKVIEENIGRILAKSDELLNDLFKSTITEEFEKKK